jgi:nucleotide-binding universal stress UspA family protein
MKEFKKILFPVDLSESSPKIVPYVTTMAEKFDSEIHLLFVARILDYFSTIYVPLESITTFAKELIEGANKRLQEFKNEYFQAATHITAGVVHGDVADEILKYIQSEEIDMIIMGTHGRKGLDKIVFGSIAERVAKATRVPVLLVKPEANS